MLSDSQWERIAPLLSGKEGDPGRTGRDNRLFVEAVLYVFDRVEFRRAGRQGQDGDVVRYGQLVDGCLIEHEDGVGARPHLGCDLVQAPLHGQGVAARQNDGGDHRNRRRVQPRAPADAQPARRPDESPSPNRGINSFVKVKPNPCIYPPGLRIFPAGDRRWTDSSPTRSGLEGSSRNDFRSGSLSGLPPSLFVHSLRRRPSARTAFASLAARYILAA